MSKLIGFAGKAQTGKTTAAKVLEEKGYRIVSFASGVREECVAFLEKYGITFRMCNFYGTKEDKEEILTFGGCRRPLAETPEFLEFIHQQSPQALYALSFKFSARQLMQWWGTNYRRKQNSNYWVDKAGARIEAFMKEGFNVTVDDCRFPDEAIMIKSLGGRMFCVVREDRPVIDGAEHESETALDNFIGFDGYIMNHSGLDKYKAKILDIAKEKV